MIDQLYRLCREAAQQCIQLAQCAPHVSRAEAEYDVGLRMTTLAITYLIDGWHRRDPQASPASRDRVLSHISDSTKVALEKTFGGEFQVRLVVLEKEKQDATRDEEARPHRG